MPQELLLFVSFLPPFSFLFPQLSLLLLQLKCLKNCFFSFLFFLLFPFCFLSFHCFFFNLNASRIASFRFFSSSFFLSVSSAFIASSSFFFLATSSLFILFSSACCFLRRDCRIIFSFFLAISF